MLQLIYGTVQEGLHSYFEICHENMDFPMFKENFGRTLDLNHMFIPCKQINGNQ